MPTPSYSIKILTSSSVTKKISTNHFSSFLIVILVTGFCSSYNALGIWRSKINNIYPMKVIRDIYFSAINLWSAYRSVTEVS